MILKKTIPLKLQMVFAENSCYRLKFSEILWLFSQFHCASCLGLVFLYRRVVMKLNLLLSFIRLGTPTAAKT